MRNTIEEMNKTFCQITQFMQVAQALILIPAKNDDQYIWMLTQVVVYSEVIVCENHTFCIIYWIVSHLKDDGLLLSVTITY